MNKWPLVVLLMMAISFLSACNTMAGVGKDVGKAGDKIEDKAEDCKDGKC
jgi:predicted small secreted protein